MPLYEYKCTACGREYEELVPRDAVAAPPCPSCASQDVEKKMSAFAAGPAGQSCGTSGFS